jgi:hypothetical protein
LGEGGAVGMQSEVSDQSSGPNEVTYEWDHSKWKLTNLAVGILLPGTLGRDVECGFLQTDVSSATNTYKRSNSSLCGRMGVFHGSVHWYGCPERSRRNFPALGVGIA